MGLRSRVSQCKWAEFWENRDHLCLAFQGSGVAAVCVCMQAGLGRIKSNLGSRVKKGKMSEAAAAAAMARVQVSQRSNVSNGGRLWPSEHKRSVGRVKGGLAAALARV